MPLLKNKRIKNLIYLKASLLGLLFMFLILACASAQNTTTSSIDKEVLSQNIKEQSCAPSKSFQRGTFRLYNNQWGSKKVKKGNINICIYNFKEKSDTLFGWRFKMPSKSFGVVAYPEILYGYNFWKDTPTPNNKTIAQLHHLNEFNITYNAHLKTNGKKMNLATDIWIVSDSLSYNKVIHSEIMVWEYANKFKPNGKKMGSISTPEGTYDLYVGKIHRKEMGLRWQYIAFVRNGNRTRGKIPLKELINYGISKEILSPELYISRIEFGTELSNASGSIYFTEYQLNIQ